jgi:hypothetical protein
MQAGFREPDRTQASKSLAFRRTHADRSQAEIRKEGLKRAGLWNELSKTHALTTL